MKQNELFDILPLDTLAFENQARKKGFRRIAGIDEAGRGALAGPVIAAAVILPEGLRIPGVDDSKKLSPETREQLFDVIMGVAVSVGIGIGDAQLIDHINILQATRYAMLEAATALSIQPDFLLIDGIYPIETTIPQKTIIKGDSLSLSIAAASIIAKVSRDRMMRGFEQVYPGYGFAKHKGYGCLPHMEAIRLLKPTEVHRKTFSGVKEHLL